MVDNRSIIRYLLGQVLPEALWNIPETSELNSAAETEARGRGVGDGAESINPSITKSTYITTLG